MVLTQTDLKGIKKVAQGKVRDIYQVGEHLLIVATDRLSAFDVVLPDGIPDKGRVLNLLSVFWFEKFARLIHNHLISAKVDEFPAVLAPHREVIKERAMLVYQAKPLPVECVVRGYLAGSGWNDYQKTGAVCGIKLPPGLQQAEKLPQPIFTPSTKSHTGHDENISFEEMKSLVGEELAQKVRRISIEIYEEASEYARQKGIIIADTKFEFGIYDGKLMLIDEVLTPDSSRFWSEKEYRLGISPPSFDKQFVRDYLDSTGWNRQPPAPHLPPEVIAGTTARYREAYRMLTGKELD
ncbi:phosphoribosylaminoimidazolesuccinocarboxamide synthase [candidate division WOR-3 bacterium]|nr:phosphoribosylaminoimidazolesuccinocarboxamide synthase [candidate division WOR-3 bacterium]